MAYQNVATPRFYVNMLEWLASVGIIALPTDHFRTLPVGMESVGDTTSYNYGNTFSPAGVFNDKSFFAVLGLERADGNLLIPTHIDDDETNAIDWIGSDDEILINCTPSDSAWATSYDGFSIGSFDADNFYGIGIKIKSSTSFGSIVLGTYYDMPHSPDLNLIMSRESGGIKNIETKGGASLSNSFYNGSPKWGELGAWELSIEGNATANQELSYKSRRIWDLSFSYLQDSDLFPEISNLNYYQAYDIDGIAYGGDTEVNELNKTLLYGNDFYSQVLLKTNFGQLPFIFNPAGGGNAPNHSPDMFAICKFDMNSFQFKQVANGVYNVKLKIREVW